MAPYAGHDDPRSQRERMEAGDPYLADDPQLQAMQTRAAGLVQRFNGWPAEDRAGRDGVLRELLGSMGEDVGIRPPFFCDYGAYITIGDRTFANFGLIALDVAPIVIGDDVLIGPNVQLVTPTHPLDPTARREKWEAAEPITIGDNAWLGAGVIVAPGVTIGENTVVGAGSVVTRDLPADVLALGSPARVARSLLPSQNPRLAEWREPPTESRGF